jgi:hypothetical protein
MGTFYRIAQLPNGSVSERNMFKAKLIYRNQGAAVDCELVDLACGQRVSPIDSYPRWTESELTLLVRLLQADYAIVDCTTAEEVAKIKRYWNLISPPCHCSDAHWVPEALQAIAPSENAV